MVERDIPMLGDTPDGEMFLQSRIAELEAENERLTAQIAKATDPAYLEKKLRQIGITDDMATEALSRTGAVDTLAEVRTTLDTALLSADPYRYIRAALSALEPAAPEGQQPAAWNDVVNAPKDGTMLRLLVRPGSSDENGWTPFADSSEPYQTIGFNALSDTGEDEWQFAGWDWCHDCFIDGAGEVIGWIPFYTRPSEQAVTEALFEALKWFIDDIDGSHTKMVDFDENVAKARSALKSAMEAGR